MENRELFQRLERELQTEVRERHAAQLARRHAALERSAAAREEWAAAAVAEEERDRTHVGSREEWLRLHAAVVAVLGSGEVPSLEELTEARRWLLSRIPVDHPEAAIGAWEITDELLAEIASRLADLADE